ncbi:MAG: hypothetical protein ABR588_07690 [Sphingomicrobium sp.]
MTSEPITLADSKALAGGILADGRFAAWIHWDRHWSHEDSEIVKTLVHKGCRFLFATGPEPASLHDAIDDVVIGAVSDLVLTLSADAIDENSAFQFISTRCPNEAQEFRLLGVLGSALKSDLEILSKLCRAIAKCD